MSRVSPSCNMTGILINRGKFEHRVRDTQGEHHVTREAERERCSSISRGMPRIGDHHQEGGRSQEGFHPAPQKKLGPADT